MSHILRHSEIVSESEDAHETILLIVNVLKLPRCWTQLTQDGAEESTEDQQGHDPDQGDLCILELW